MRTRILALALVSAVGVSANAGTFYTNELTWSSFVVGGSYLENFNSIPGFELLGPTWDAPGGNGFGWQAEAANDLFANAGALSTNSAEDTIRITFTGAPVSAFGAYLANTDITGSIINGTTQLAFSNGETQTINNTAGNDVFLGWAGVDASETILWVDVTSSFTAGSDWTQLDDVTVGAVPEPATLAVLGLGLAAAARRRKKA